MQRGAARYRVVGVVLGLLIVMSAPLVSLVAQRADAVSSGPNPACGAGVGVGGIGSTTLSVTRGGNGCVVIVAGSTRHTFNFTEAIESWTVPSGVTSITFHLLGAGGGGARLGGGNGGGGGYATGTLAVTPGQVFDIIVGGGGVRQCVADVPPLSPTLARYNASFGGGGSGNGSPGYDCTWASGGGRSAVRLGGGFSDIITAAGGGGGGYSGSGGAGGGSVGTTGNGCGGTGGTQSSAGLGCTTSEPGGDGTQYGGGWAGYSLVNPVMPSEGGGGGGGYFGGGGAGDNGGGGGGSSYVGSLSAASTVGGSGIFNGMPDPVMSSLPTVTGSPSWGSTLTAVSGTWSGTSTASWQWQVSTDGVTFTNIPGATLGTYVVGVSGFVRVVETRSTPFARVSATSSDVSVPTSSTTPTTSTTTASSVSPVSPTTISPTTSVVADSSVSTTTAVPVVVPNTNDSTLGINPFDVVDGISHFLDLSVSLAPGDNASGAAVMSTAHGLRSGSVLTLDIREPTQVIDARVTDVTGALQFPSNLPADLSAGLHLVVLRGVTPQGVEVTSTVAFELDASGTVMAVMPASESVSGVPSASRVARAMKVGVRLYDASSNSATTARLAIIATVLTALLAAAALSGGSSRVAVMSNAANQDDSRDAESQGEIGGIDADTMTGAGHRDRGPGDDIPTWALPGHRAHQGLVARAHAVSATKSALLGRLLADGHWLRAVFGPLQLIVWAVAAVLGVVAGFGVSGVVAPSFTWVGVLVVLALLDAFAGTSAWIGFAAVLLVRFGVSSIYDVRTLLGLGVLFMGVPLIAHHARPIRRVFHNDLDRVDRAADYVVLPILMSFAAASIYTALNGLSGLALVSDSRAKSFGGLVAAVLVGRLLLEDIVMRTHPQRMRDTAFAESPGTPMWIEMLTIVMKGALFLLAAGSFFGFGWRTWLVVALLSAVPTLKLFTDKLPNFAALHRWFPRGVLRAVLMLWVGLWLARLILGGDSSPEHTKEMMAVLLVPGIAIGVVDVIGRSGGEWPDTLWKRLVGGCLWTFSFLVMFGVVVIG